jgi:hypothetical protein
VKSVKSVPAGPTLRVTPPDLDREPLAAVTVIGYDPVGVDEEVEIDSVVEPEPATVLGVKVAAVPAGNPATLNCWTEPLA